MIRDPLYRSIVDGLEGHLDTEVFERCAQDLLRENHPTLVPVRGGTDGGMDGAVAEGKGPTFPLVCTTGKDVKRNLEASLRSYLRRKGKRRSLIMATSQLLTARRRVNLEEAAAALGFSVVQIYDQAAMANLLYRHPEWCEELLGLTGAPPPLSVLPATKRWLGDQPLIGRESDLRWLKEAEGDIVISGQPGSGKTFLMYILAREDDGLFVVSSDRAVIANGIRSQRPKSLLIDDAHLHPDLLLSLRSGFLCLPFYLVGRMPSYRMGIRPIRRSSYLRQQVLE